MGVAKDTFPAVNLHAVCVSNLSVKAVSRPALDSIPTGLATFSVVAPSAPRHFTIVVSSAALLSLLSNMALSTFNFEDHIKIK